MLTYLGGTVQQFVAGKNDVPNLPDSPGTAQQTHSVCSTALVSHASIKQLDY